MKFKIDSREHNEDLFTSFDLLGAEKGFTYEKTFLDVGDITCGNIVIERKTAGDFIGSIMDGRLKEQSAKMSLNYKFKYIIIEGNPFRTESEIHTHAIIGKMTSLAVKHQIHILTVENPSQLVYMCWSLINKHIMGGTFNPAEHNVLRYKVKDEEFLSSCLYQISNLGIEKAKTISEMFNNSFTEFMNNVTKEKLKMIDGVGDKLSERIISLFKK